VPFAGLAVALAIPVIALAAPSSHTLSIKAAPNPVTFGKTLTVSGQLTGKKNGGETIKLQSDPYPYNGLKTEVEQKTTSSGAYSFSGVAPTRNTMYRAVAKTSPPTVSKTVLVLVRKVVSMRVSDSTPAKNQKVSFRGSVRPPHDGMTVSIQRRTSTGHYKTIGSGPLLHVDSKRSRYVVKIKIARGGLFRARVPHDADHTSGRSKLVRLRVHSS
jgi:hypothetical protein